MNPHLLREQCMCKFDGVIINQSCSSHIIVGLVASGLSSSYAVTFPCSLMQYTFSHGEVVAIYSDIPVSDWLLPFCGCRHPSWYVCYSRFINIVPCADIIFCTSRACKKCCFVFGVGTKLWKCDSGTAWDEVAPGNCPLTSPPLNTEVNCLLYTSM